MSKGKPQVNQLFDRQFVVDIVAASIISYLIGEGYDDEDSIDNESIFSFIQNNFDFVVQQVIDSSKMGDDDAHAS